MRIKLDIPLSLAEIASVTGSTLLCTDAFVDHICTDSREVSPGDLFIALSGERNDGNEFAGDVSAKGGYVLGARCASIFSEDTRSAILDLAAAYTQKLPCLRHTVAITGSVGKTTTKELAARILSGKYKVHASEKNFNNEIGLLHTVLSASCATELLLIEMGMNHRGEISRLSKAVRPDIAVITNIGTAHIGNLGSREAIAQAKLEIKDGMTEGMLIVPSDEELLKQADAGYTVALYPSAGDGILSVTSTSTTESRFSFRGRNLVLENERISLTGIHLLTSLTYALAIADVLNVSTQIVRSQLSTIDPTCMRQRRIRIGRYYIYDDTYSSSPEAAIAVMRALTQEKEAAVSAVLGDMLELGASSDELHRAIGIAAAECGIRKLYLFGSSADRIAEGAIAGGISERDIFINRYLDKPHKTADQIRASYNGELLLFKASHAVHAERIYEFLKD